MTYHIILTPQAQEDLDAHFAYIFQRNPQGAQNVYDVIVGRIQLLRDFPYASRQGAVPGTREVITKKYPYRIVFEIIGETIYIVHIKHGAQQWPPRGEDDEEEGSDVAC